MLSWAIRRKFLIIMVLALALGAAVFGGYELFLKKPPSCLNGKQDGNETGIDCGGSCAKLCTEEVKKPIMLWDPRILPVSDKEYSVLVYFENPNASASVPQARYTIRLFSKTNSLIEERHGVISIPPHARFAVLESGFPVKEVAPSRADFSWDESLNWQRTNAGDPEVAIQNKVLSNPDTKPRLDALLINQSLSDIPALELVAIISDGAGNAVGASKTILSNVARGASVPVTFTWPKAFTTTRTVCEKPVDAVLLIDRSGSMQNISQDPPQPLSDVKAAAKDFLAALRPEDKAAIISFANAASDPADFPLSLDRDSANRAIDAIMIGTKGAQNTNIADSFAAAGALLGDAADPARTQAVILLTDGDPTLPTKSGVKDYPQIAAQSEAQKLKDGGVAVFTIGLGKTVNAGFLRSISASSTAYFEAPSAAALSDVYRSIALEICSKKPAQIDIIPRIAEPQNL